MEQGVEMQFPLSLSDVSLWLAYTAIILLITSTLISPYYGKKGIPINKRLLRKAAITVGLLFMFTVFIRIYQIIIS
jgi:hypothetical protein